MEVGVRGAEDKGRIPSSMEIYARIHRARSELDVAASADGDTNGGHSHRNWPEQHPRENICDRRPIRPMTARESTQGRLPSARRLRPSSSSKSNGLILTPSWREAPARFQTIPNLKPVGDLSVRHRPSSGKPPIGVWKFDNQPLNSCSQQSLDQHSFSKRSVWDRDGALSPLTLEAMQKNGVLSYELQPTPPASDGDAVAALRYSFREQHRQALELEVLKERNQLAALRSARSGSKEGLLAVFVRFAASKDTDQNLQSHLSSRASVLDFNEFMRSLKAMKLVPEAISVDDAADAFRQAADSSMEMCFEPFFHTLLKIVRKVDDGSQESGLSMSSAVTSAAVGSQMLRRSLGKTVEKEISKKKVALEHLKIIEERRLALEFQQEIDLNTRRKEIIVKIQESSARTAKVQEELKKQREAAALEAKLKHEAYLALLEEKHAKEAAEAAEHAQKKADRDARQRLLREEKILRECQMKTEMQRLRHEALQQRRARTERRDAHRRAELSHVCLYVCVFMCACVSVCMSVCACVCVNIQAFIHNICLYVGIYNQ